jgi:hypothetical protein
MTSPARRQIPPSPPPPLPFPGVEGRVCRDLIAPIPDDGQLEWMLKVAGLDYPDDMVGIDAIARQQPVIDGGRLAFPYRNQSDAGPHCAGDAGCPSMGWGVFGAMRCVKRPKPERHGARDSANKYPWMGQGQQRRHQPTSLRAGTSILPITTPVVGSDGERGA